MLITTSKRPGHRTRILCRELTMVLPNARYVPRGTKTVEQLALLAGELGHSRVMLLNSATGQPKEMLFFEVKGGWRWLDARVELGEVKLQRDLNQRVKLEGVKIYAEAGRARELADFLSRVFDVPLSNELPRTGAVARITSDDELKLRFEVRPGPELVGPVLHITRFG